MGEVYLGLDEALARKVAIKRVPPERDTPESPERLRNEARTLARLSHPNVVQVYEVAEHEGQTFLAMEYVEGTTLTGWLKEPHSWQEDPRGVRGRRPRAGGGALGFRDPPRLQARQRAHQQGRPRVRGRLWSGGGRRHRRLGPTRGLRDRSLHVARAIARRGHRCAQRSVQLLHRALRGAVEARALRSRERGRSRARARGRAPETSTARHGPAGPLASCSSRSAKRFPSSAGRASTRCSRPWRPSPRADADVPRSRWPCRSRWPRLGGSHSARRTKSARVSRASSSACGTKTPKLGSRAHSRLPKSARGRDPRACRAWPRRMGRRMDIRAARPVQRRAHADR